MSHDVDKSEATDLEVSHLNVKLVRACALLGVDGAVFFKGHELSEEFLARSCEVWCQLRVLRLFMEGLVSHVISLRATRSADLPSLFENGCDPVANALAGSKPRTWEEFEPRWEELMRDRTATMRAILLDGELVGAINVLLMDGVNSLGYWIARPHWGKGVASKAVELMLQEVKVRPLYATAAAHNVASIRVLIKQGFVETSRKWTVETERSVARETVTLRLD